MICCAHSVPSSVAQHARRGPRARRGGGSRCISFPSFWGSARIKNNVSFCPQSGRQRSTIASLGHKLQVACQTVPSQEPSDDFTQHCASTRTGLTSRGMSAGPSPVVARLQGRIWVQQLQKQYRSVPRNMARMADESRVSSLKSRRERQEPQVRTHKTRHFGSRHCPLSAGLDADIGLAHSPPPDRSNPKSSPSVARWGSGGVKSGFRSPRVPACGRLDSRRTCPLPLAHKNLDTREATPRARSHPDGTISTGSVSCWWCSRQRQS